MDVNYIPVGVWGLVVAGDDDFGASVAKKVDHQSSFIINEKTSHNDLYSSPSLENP